MGVDGDIDDDIGDGSSHDTGVDNVVGGDISSKTGSEDACINGDDGGS